MEQSGLHPHIPGNRKTMIKDIKWIDEGQALSLDRIIRFVKAFPVDFLKTYLRSFCYKSGLNFELVLQRIIGPCWSPTLRNI